MSPLRRPMPFLLLLFLLGAPAVQASRYEKLVSQLGKDAEKEVVQVTSALVAFRTVSAGGKSAAPEFRKMRGYLQRWAKQHGFDFRAVGTDDVFEIGWGRGPVKLALVFHGDVVPAPRHEWSRDPFKVHVADGRLFGRGVEDDKGPIAAAMTAMAGAKRAGLRPDGRILLIIGNGEENDWGPMRRYAESAPPMTHVVSVDSGFPVIAGQSGFVAFALRAKADGVAPEQDGLWLEVVDATAGEFLTQVPGRASMTLRVHGRSAAEAEAEVRRVIAALREAGRAALQAEVTKQEDGTLKVVTSGRAVHASGAEHGHNALWDLSALAAKLPLRENGTARLLKVVASHFDGDHHGRKLGLYYEDTLMGPLLVAPTVLRTEKGEAVLRVNMRRPQGKDAEAWNRSLDAAAALIAKASGGEVTELTDQRYSGDPHLAEVSGPLVQKLLDIYRKHRPGDADPKPGAIRGGTYGRLFKGAVDFGPAFPGEPYTGHAPDESISIGNLETLTLMLADAMYELALKKD